jgi:excinuclease ABC subunit A
MVETQNWLIHLKNEKKYAKKIHALSEVYNEVLHKISLLVKLGLGSAHLFRRCKTLSGGEYQRVLLTRVIGNGLTDALYVLDEPSVGLGKEEIPELINCLRELRDLGNTVLMVEHDKSLILAADQWIELGPGGGKNGGEILKKGESSPLSALAQNLFHPNMPSSSFCKKVELANFSALNCHDLSIEFYLEKLNVITGNSGAGKSTLVKYGLQAALEKLIDTGITYHDDFDEDRQWGVWKKLICEKEFLNTHEIIMVEQKALHRTITSVPATLLGLMDLLRKHFSQTREAKQRGLGPSDFSFNGEGGCPTCSGKGIVQDDLFFLGQVEKVCPDCEGTRYKNEVSRVSYLGKNIHEWLNTTLEECSVTFGGERKWASSLKLACDLGLGHISLGMPTSTLSGGEAQRLRLCAALSKSEKKLFCILDEPTRGLSEKDVSHLIDVLLRLTQKGHTFVVVEHHELFQQQADYLIKMGPKSGINGGKIVGKIIQFSNPSGH